jgi:hypothetical protein
MATLGNDFGQWTDRTEIRIVTGLDILHRLRGVITDGGPTETVPALFTRYAAAYREVMCRPLTDYQDADMAMLDLYALNRQIAQAVQSLGAATPEAHPLPDADSPF